MSMRLVMHLAVVVGCAAWLVNVGFVRQPISFGAIFAEAPRLVVVPAIFQPSPPAVVPPVVVPPVVVPPVAVPPVPPAARPVPPIVPPGVVPPPIVSHRPLRFVVPKDKTANQQPSNEPLKTPFLRSLFEQIGQFSDKEIDNKRDLQQQLREADVLYARIKTLNVEGLRRANNPPKRKLPVIVVPAPPKPAPRAGNDSPSKETPITDRPPVEKPTEKPAASPRELEI